MFSCIHYHKILTVYVLPIRSGQRLLPVRVVERHVSAGSGHRPRGSPIRSHEDRQVRVTWLRIHGLLDERAQSARSVVFREEVLWVRSTATEGPRATLPQGPRCLPRGHLPMCQRYRSEKVTLLCITLFSAYFGLHVHCTYYGYWNLNLVQETVECANDSSRVVTRKLLMRLETLIVGLITQSDAV